MRREMTALAVLLVWASAGVAQEPVEEAPATGETPVETIPVESAPEAEAAAPENRTLLDTIEVTAQRRKERLVDVPVAVTAFTQDQIEARGIKRLDDLNSLAPGLQVSRSPADTTISQLTIRGSSQINPAIYWDPAVGVYLDGVYIGKAQGSIFDIVDLASVEVLRGPQGTLYGRNTIAGTVNFITRPPSGDFSGNASVEMGNFNGRTYRAALDLPHAGFVNLSLGVRSERRDPWVDTSATSPEDGLNNRQNDGARLGALFDLADGLEAQYALDYSKTDQASTFLQLVRSNDAALAPYVSTERQEQADINSPSTEFSDVTGHALTVTWDVADWLTLKSITGMRQVEWIDQLDLDGTPEDVGHSKRDTDYEQKSQDLNFSGKAGAFHYTGGGYYFEDDGFTNNPIHVEIYQQGQRVPIDFDSNYGTRAKAVAAYGQVDWQVLDPLTVSAGARYTKEQKDLDRLFGFSSNGAPYVYYISNDPNPSPTPSQFHADGVEFTNTSPMASVAWRFTPQINTYVRYAAGFKSGGFNGEYSDVQGTSTSNQQETNTPFRPEKQRSLELGVKTSFLDGQLLFNAAAYQNKLQDLQASIFTATGAAATVVRNAGRATVRGVELESAVVPFEGTTVRVNAAFMDSGYDEFIDGGANVADNRAFVHAPRSSYNLVLDSELLQTGWGTLLVVTDYVWTDAFYTYPYQLRTVDTAKQTAGDSEVEAYGLLNVRLSLTRIPVGGSMSGEVALWGRNVLDEAIANNYIDFGPAFNNLTVANFVEPAAFGVAALFRF